MTRIDWKGLKIRIWRKEESESFSDEQTRNDISVVLVGYNGTSFGRMYVAKHILQTLPRANAVEVLNDNGDGVVLYADWP